MFFQVLCMNVAIHKENYHGYVERHTILQNQQQIMAHLQMPPPPPAQQIQPLVHYKHWNIKFVDWTIDVPEDEDSEEEESEATTSE